MQDKRIILETERQRKTPGGHGKKMIPCHLGRGRQTALMSHLFVKKIVASWVSTPGKLMPLWRRASTDIHVMQFMCFLL